MLQSSNHVVCWVGTLRLRHSTPLDAVERGGTVAVYTVVELQERRPSFEDHAAAQNLKEAAGQRSRFVEQEPGHQRSKPTEPYTEVQMGVGWAENDEKLRNEVLLLEEHNETPRSSVGDPWSSGGRIVGVVYIAEKCSQAPDTTGSKIVAMGKVEVRGVEHIVVLVAVGRDTGMDALMQCVVQLVEVMHNDENLGGSMCNAGRVHCANTLVPADEVEHGSG